MFLLFCLSQNVFIDQTDLPVASKPVALPTTPNRCCIGIQLPAALQDASVYDTLQRQVAQMHTLWIQKEPVLKSKQHAACWPEFLLAGSKQECACPQNSDVFFMILQGMLQSAYCFDLGALCTCRTRIACMGINDVHCMPKVSYTAQRALISGVWSRT